MLIILEGYPGSGKTYMANQITRYSRRNGAVHTIDADDITQSLITSNYKDCNHFRRKMVAVARNAIRRKINKIPACDTIILGGVVNLMFNDPTCMYQIAGCAGCGKTHHDIERIWLDITPVGGNDQDELEESIKRAVLRELALPAAEWTVDPTSDDPWERQQPPPCPINKNEFNALFTMPASIFRQMYPCYFTAMAESFRLDHIDIRNRQRAIANGYKPLTPAAILARFT
jgi:hypothetical protein